MHRVSGAPPSRSARGSRGTGALPDRDAGTQGHRCTARQGRRDAGSQGRRPSPRCPTGTPAAPAAQVHCPTGTPRPPGHRDAGRHPAARQGRRDAGSQMHCPTGTQSFTPQPGPENAPARAATADAPRARSVTERDGGTIMGRMRRTTRPFYGKTYEFSPN